MVFIAELIGRLALGAFLGSVIGWESERRAWTAGLRTHMMMCLGATGDYYPQSKEVNLEIKKKRR